MRPVLFEFSSLGLSLRSYELCLAFGLLLGWVLSLARAKQDKLPTETMGVAYLVTALSGVLGARGLWLVQHPDHFAGPLSLLQLQAGEMALFGALLAGGIASAAYVSRQGVPPAAWFDCLGPALLVGLALEGIGAFLAGTDFGLYSPELAWGVRFPPASPAHAFQRATLDGVIAPTSSALAVHPTQLYGVALAVVGLFLAHRLKMRRGFSGQIAAFCFAWFALARMVVQEMFTARRNSIEVMGLDIIVVAGLFFVLVAGFGYRQMSLRAARDPKPDAYRLWLGGPWPPPTAGADKAEG